MEKVVLTEQQKKNGFVINCFVKAKPNETELVLFNEDKNGVVTAWLDGYAIVPIEEYYELTGINEDEEAE